jgi:hypothetical protein
MRIVLEADRTHEIVEEMDIPDFKSEPDVIIWGTRVFVSNPASRRDNAYEEAFAYTVPG